MWILIFYVIQILFKFKLNDESGLILFNGYTSRVFQIHTINVNKKWWLNQFAKLLIFPIFLKKKTVTGQLPRTATPTTTAKPAWTGMNASNCDDYLKLSYPVEDSCKNIH